MASLNLSTYGANIKSSYNAVVSGPPPSSDSPTYAQWALFSVQAPLLNAFQESGGRESVLKVQSTGDGELADLIEDFSEGRIQYAFVKVKDPNTALPKNVLIAWCGEGVPERTKGYFTSHTTSVSKVLHGYHVQITARSESDLEPSSIMQKVADASGSKYSGGGSTGKASAPPPIKSKPVFTPTTSGAGRLADPLVAARSRRDENVDDDGWGADAPPVTRTQIEKVAPAYKPTKVDMADLTKQKPESSRFAGASQSDGGPSDVVGGGYQPVGKVDIAAIRAQAKQKGDDRPTPVKGAYEPVGKVDIAAIKARAQKPADEGPEDTPAPKPVADRAAAFSQPNQSERLTSLPKPKVANKFGGASTFTGTKAPVPGGLGGFGSPAPPPPTVGGASRTFADEGGKTPAQIWAEKKAKEGGGAIPSAAVPSPSAPVETQKSGNGWKSGYTGKNWAPVQTGGYGGDVKDSVSEHNTGDGERATAEEQDSGAGGVSALRDRFKDTSLIGSAPSPPVASRGVEDDDGQTAPPPVPSNSRPSGGFALPGLPSRPPPVDDEEEEEDPSAYEAREQSPIRVAEPVGRGAEAVHTEPEERPVPSPIPVSHVPVPAEEDILDEEPVGHLPEQVAAAEPIEAAAASQGGHRALIQYDYEKAEGNEIDLIEGEYVTNIDMVDEDWWVGTNSSGQSGLFPSNYVELVGDEEDAEEEEAPAPPPPPPAAEPAAAAAGSESTATALYDYEAAEDNELSFPEDAQITNVEFPDEDWWFGHYNGRAGLFPANYVQLDS